MSTDETDRRALRERLLATRRDWAATPAFAAAQAQIQARLAELLEQLEPELVGVYWPLPGEFALSIDGPALALPYARRGGQMDYRRWDGAAPTLKDECGIPSSGGAVAVPDVVLVPCVGFSRQGFRLGYGGGYFDRWLARHAGVTSVGLAWSGAEIALLPAAHDQTLTLVLTEAGAIVAE